MKRPMIGIMPSKYGEAMGVSWRYLNALRDCGNALGVILPYTTDKEKINEYVGMFDGFLFSGGIDIDPKYYGEEKQFDSVQIDEERDSFEAAMFKPVYESKKPILGICRGIQVLNVFMGGTLYQHIDNHMQTIPGYQTEQKVKVVEGGLLAKITGKTELITNSFHHQNVKELGKGLICDAYSEDGYIECFHDTNHPFFLGIQWHPEMYYPTDPAMQNVFREFVGACNKSL